jgi:hypothetical protein
VIPIGIVLLLLEIVVELVVEKSKFDSSSASGSDTARSSSSPTSSSSGSTPHVAGRAGGATSGRGQRLLGAGGESTSAEPVEATVIERRFQGGRIMQSKPFRSGRVKHDILRHSPRKNRRCCHWAEGQSPNGVGDVCDASPPGLRRGLLDGRAAASVTGPHRSPEAPRGSEGVTRAITNRGFGRGPDAASRQVW